MVRTQATCMEEILVARSTSTVEVPSHDVDWAEPWRFQKHLTQCAMREAVLFSLVSPQSSEHHSNRHLEPECYTCELQTLQYVGISREHQTLTMS
jgi:hypothetical protein